MLKTHSVAFKRSHNEKPFNPFLINLLLSSLLYLLFVIRLLSLTIHVRLKKRNKKLENEFSEKISHFILCGKLGEVKALWWRHLMRWRTKNVRMLRETKLLLIKNSREGKTALKKLSATYKELHNKIKKTKGKIEINFITLSSWESSLTVLGDVTFPQSSCRSRA